MTRTSLASTKRRGSILVRRLCRITPSGIVRGLDVVAGRTREIARYGHRLMTTTPVSSHTIPEGAVEGGGGVTPVEVEANGRSLIGPDRCAHHGRRSPGLAVTRTMIRIDQDEEGGHAPRATPPSIPAKPALASRRWTTDSGRQPAPAVQVGGRSDDPGAVDAWLTRSVRAVAQAPPPTVAQGRAGAGPQPPCRGRVESDAVASQPRSITASYLTDIIVSHIVE